MGDAEMTHLHPLVRGLCAAAAMAGGMTVATPLFAQAAEEITVTGRYGAAPDSARTLSQVVSYADLDLSTKVGRDMFRRRVNLTSRFLCDKLGETGASSSLTPSCRDEATRSAMTRVGTIEEGFAPRGTTWVRGPEWQAPYPADWATSYP
jgi:UrcA family protein